MSNVNLPGIDVYNEINPTLTSPYSSFELPFIQTADTLMDVEVYRNFLNNAITRFRRNRTYKHYKGFLIDLGMNRCQFHGNITVDMASVEMHHNMLTIFDIAVIITEHVLKTYGGITTFDLVTLLAQAHKQHKVQLVMLSLTPHQLYHNSDMIIHPDMCFGKWWEFLEEYHKGINFDIANKLIININEALKVGSSDDNGLLELREKIKDWSGLNEYGYSHNPNI